MTRKCRNRDWAVTPLQMVSSRPILRGKKFKFGLQLDVDKF